MIINGHRIETIVQPDPSKLPWKELGIDLVIECTGNLNKEGASNAHIDAGAKVIISAAANGVDATVME